MTTDELLLRWSERQRDFARMGALVKGECLCADILLDLEQLRASEDEATLPLDDAAYISGYSTDHLRRLVREGKLPCVRRGRELFFRLRDLPKEPGAIDVTLCATYDPVADARRVARRRTHGGLNHGTQEAT